MNYFGQIEWQEIYDLNGTFVILQPLKNARVYNIEHLKRIAPIENEQPVLTDPIVNTHRELVEGAKAGMRKAQFRLYELYVDAMYNVCLRIVKRKEDAQDVIQDCFVQAFTKLDQFRYETTFGAWLKRIVVNKSLNFLRDRKMVFEQWEPVDVASETVAEKSEPKQDLGKVKTAMQILPEGQRQILNLYLVEGYDHVEISEILNISTGTSKSQYSRAKKKLVEIVKTL